MRCDDIFSSLSCEAKILNKKNFSRQFLHTFVRTCRITYTLTKTYIHSGTKHIHIQRCTGALAVVMLCWCVCGWVYAFKKERRISLWWCFLLAIMSSCLPLKCSHTLLSLSLSSQTQGGTAAAAARSSVLTCYTEGPRLSVFLNKKSF